MYKARITENRKNLNLDNNIIIVESNLQATNLNPLTLYKWKGRLNINLRQYTKKSQFGDLIFSNKTEAMQEKNFILKELQSNKENLKKELQQKIKYNRRIRTIKEKLKNNCMNNDYITCKNINDLIIRYHIQLTLNEHKNVNLVDTIYFKQSMFESMSVNKGSKLQCNTIDKILTKISFQLQNK